MERERRKRKSCVCVFVRANLVQSLMGREREREGKSGGKREDGW